MGRIIFYMITTSAICWRSYTFNLTDISVFNNIFCNNNIVDSKNLNRIL